jgi:hypothetical protein
MKIKVTTTWNKEGEIIHDTFQECLGNPFERITREIISTKEAQTRMALIELGWTPPPTELKP